MDQALPVPITVTPDWELRRDPIVHGREGRTQFLYINASELRRRIKQEGYTFRDTADYLRKYHGMKNFDLLEITRLGAELTVRIRHIGILERLRDRLRGL